MGAAIKCPKSCVSRCVATGLENLKTPESSDEVMILPILPMKLQSFGNIDPIFRHHTLPHSNMFIEYLHSHPYEITTSPCCLHVSKVFPVIHPEHSKSINKLDMNFKKLWPCSPMNPILMFFRCRPWVSSPPGCGSHSARPPGRPCQKRCPMPGHDEVTWSSYRCIVCSIDVKYVCVLKRIVYLFIYI